MSNLKPFDLVVLGVQEDCGPHGLHEIEQLKEFLQTHDAMKLASCPENMRVGCWYIDDDFAGDYEIFGRVRFTREAIDRMFKEFTNIVCFYMSNAAFSDQGSKLAGYALLGEVISSYQQQNPGLSQSNIRLIPVYPKPIKQCRPIDPSFALLRGYDINKIYRDEYTQDNIKKMVMDLSRDGANIREGDTIFCSSETPAGTVIGVQNCDVIQQDLEMHTVAYGPTRVTQAGLPVTRPSDAPMDWENS